MDTSVFLCKHRWVKTSDLGVNFTLIEKNDGFFDLATSSLDSDNAAISGLMGEALYTHDSG